MAKLIRRKVSGARVMFDPRTTREADANRDMRNHVTLQRPLRTERYWERKRKEQNASANRR